MDGGPGEVRKGVLHQLREVLLLLGAQQVGLVPHHDQPAVLVGDGPGDLLVLVGDGLGGVQDEEAEVRTPDGLHRLDHGKGFLTHGDLARFAQAGGVEKDEPLPAALHLHIHRVTGGAGDGGDGDAG